jgi:hypothetical protein
MSDLAAITFLAWAKVEEVRRKRMTGLRFEQWTGHAKARSVFGPLLGDILADTRINKAP